MIPKKDPIPAGIFGSHCQFERYFVCKDGPVFRWDQVERLMQIREV